MGKTLWKCPGTEFLSPEFKRYNSEDNTPRLDKQIRKHFKPTQILETS